MDKTILCIDETRMLLQLYRRVLEEHGYDVLLASSGWEGLTMLDFHPVDCVILDHHMGGTDSPAVIRHLRGLGTPPPVILVSDTDPPREIRNQVEAFVEKPMLVSQLLECVDNAVGQRKKGATERPEDRLAI
jgi:DNA-binding response OmpR family regulator